MFECTAERLKCLASYFWWRSAKCFVIYNGLYYSLVFKSLIRLWIWITEFPIKSSHQLHFALNHVAHDKQNTQSKFTTAKIKSIRFTCVRSQNVLFICSNLQCSQISLKYIPRKVINQQYNSIQIMHIKTCFWTGTGDWQLERCSSVVSVLGCLTSDNITRSWLMYSGAKSKNTYKEVTGE